jgi:hypothetical protein
MAIPWSFVDGALRSLLIAVLALGAARTWLRRRPAHAQRIETAALALAGFVGFACLFQNVLVHDALWYYGYLRSAIVDGDLDLYNEFVLRNSNAMYVPSPGTPIIPLGTTLASVPLALLARPVAILVGAAKIVPGGDGYGPIEIGAATLSAMLLGLGGIALTHRLARTYAGGAASALAQVALLYASPMAFFTFVWPAYPHPVSVFVGAAFLLVWAASPRPIEPLRALLLGLIAGVLTLVHLQDAVYLALPVIDLLDDLRAGARARALRSGALLVAGALGGFAPQIAVWMATTGRPFPNVYVEIGDPFIWSRPAFWDVLFSTYNGLATWTPLCGVAFFGLAFLRGHARILRGFVALVLLEWWAIASYGYWWGGASFGSRYFLSAYPALGVGLALVVERVARRTGLLIAGLATVPFVYWNLLLMAQFRLEWIPHNQPPPDVMAILTRQIWEAPAALIDGLCGPFGWNQVFILEHLRAALEAENFASAAAWVAVATLVLTGLFAWTHWLGDHPPRRGATDAGRACGTGAIALLGAALLGTCAVWLVADGHARSLLRAEVRPTPLRVRAGTTSVLDLLAPEEGPTAERPTAVKAQPPSTRAETRREDLRLDLVSFLHRAADVAEGRIVAWISITGPGCLDRPLPLLAGFHTAETAPDRIEVRDRMRHGIAHATVVHGWWQRTASARYYWGHAYLASWPLLPDCRPRQVVLRVDQRGPDLEVRRLAVARILRSS